MNTTTKTTQEYLTAPQVGKELKVGHEKVLSWIHSGELRAADVSTKRGQRPRWRISRDDLNLFLARRSATPPPKPRRQRRQAEDVIEFYQ